MIVGLPAAGSVDIVARIVAAGLSQRLGQNVVVENRPGASGWIAGERAARSTPDGYTLMVRGSFLSELTGSVQGKLSYDLVRDFAPITLLARSPNLLVVSAATPAQTVRDLVAYAKQNPGVLNYASSGPGSSSHLAMELLKKHAAIRIVHVPYKGAPDALAALLKQDVHVMFGNVPAQLPHLRTGKIRALAITSAERHVDLREIPTLKEARICDCDITVWYGLLAPARTPATILSRLNADTVGTLAAPEVRNRIAQQGAEPAPMSREAFAAFQRDEVARWTSVIKDLGAALQ